MDGFAYRVSNYLVGNKDGEAVLEATLLGPELEFHEAMTVAVTGANMKPELNGWAIRMWESFEVKEGDRLSLEGAAAGIRSYIAFGGELDVEPVNNSKSTYVKTGIGGFQGRRLREGDEIPVRVPDDVLSGKYLASEHVPNYEKKTKIRVVLGPQDDYFTQSGIRSFLNPQGYLITKEADRMGYRLDGETIEHLDGADIISDGTAFGSIQVPANGKPLILMADRQTSGGYTKIATVISPDLPKLSQMGSGDEMVFEAVSLEGAHEIYREYEKAMAAIKHQVESSKRLQESDASRAESRDRTLQQGRDMGRIEGPTRKMKVTVNGTLVYTVELRELKG